MNALADIEKLAQNTAQNAVKEDTPLQEKIDALKALAPYYSLLSKAKGKDDESGEPTIGDIQSRLRLVDQELPDGGSVQTRSRRRT